MLVEAQVSIMASRAAVWAVITDIEHAAEFMSGIERIEIVERPAAGLAGLRWLETRMYFGKPATIEIRVADAVENESYATRAGMDGFVFLSTMRLSSHGRGTTLTSIHETRPQNLIARIKGLPMFLFKGVVRKALLQDLADIKAVVERK